jgi:hypothetical protein
MRISLNREDELDWTKQLWDGVGTPSHFLNVNPLTPSMTPIDFQSLMEESLDMFHAKVFGSHWKENPSQFPPIVLIPEMKSNKTTKNTYEMFHLHGIISIEKEWLVKRYEKEFPRYYKKKVRDFRSRNRTNPQLQMPAIKFIRFNQALKDECFAYCTKSYGYKDGYGLEDVFVSGKKKE